MCMYVLTPPQFFMLSHLVYPFSFPFMLLCPIPLSNCLGIVLIVIRSTPLPLPTHPFFVIFHNYLTISFTVFVICCISSIVFNHPFVEPWEIDPHLCISYVNVVQLMFHPPLILSI
ncbi:hypothetical protein GLYMA_01G133600v4 [Glycine max]|uniref:Uncharacterized protein n=2 Tax=Glycine subgen. Soja TaxID=1462606 RepID=A0A0R0LAH9_SOYBN|nr:hypothetical protein JHK87_001645 [Glycine soja]KAG5069317.1 hypothetical protein JHK85_001694 [Glycine max]KAG5089041.1 hypothetical protein JHK86_001653 [Glycine max]KAH1162937.1 hypothetical protein GYH30_001452 [Glycine max]KRH76134.1 hypothetical protein GLYMA_01G133600v4 [Glycine max]